jgi:hypothetical protein
VLTLAGVENVLYTVDDAEHDFGGASDPEQLDAGYLGARAFLRRH